MRESIITNILLSILEDMSSKEYKSFLVEQLLELDKEDFNSVIMEAKFEFDDARLEKLSGILEEAVDTLINLRDPRNA